MKTSQLLLACTFLALTGASLQCMAEDIDLYSRVPSPKNNPNVLIILDNAAHASDSAPICNYDAIGLPGSGTGGASAMGATVFGNEQCAMYNVVNALPTSASGGALVNVGIMVYNATGLDVALGLPAGTCPGGNGGCLIQPLTPMTSANKTILMNFIKSWTQATIKANNEATATAMQEAWAYFAGQVGLSGRNYSGIRPSPSCVNNYVAFVGNAYNSAGTPGDPGAPSVSTALTSAYATALSTYTTAGGAAGTGMPPPPTYSGPINIPAGNYGLPPANNSCGAYNMGNHTDPSGLYADEWARFMHTSNLYYTPVGNNTITTYTIGVIGSSCQPDYPALLTSMAIHGGGKYFPTTNSTGIYQSLLRILNEVQAVNSVFSASSLPVSVNTQGTYLNQIYIGMFRPDQGGNPRWYGNLKQYQFIYNPTTKVLALGDAAGFPAISAAGTGFLDPSIASFWTCSNSTQLSSAAALLGPAYDQWAAGGPGKLPLCANDPAAGFWLKNPNGIGGAFDLPDGDVVEKGGHAQILRLTNLSDNYSAAPGSATNPRKLYTYCPGGGCTGSVPLSTYPFDVSNTAITDVMLGVASVPILTITSAGTVGGGGANSGGRTGAGAPVAITITALAKAGSIVTSTVTPASDVAAKLYVGAQLKIATGAAKYDCTPYCVVTAVNTGAGTFTYTNAGGGGTAVLPTTAALATNYFWIWSLGNTMQLGQTLTISGCTNPNFTVLNGTVATVVINPIYNSLPSSGYLDLAVTTPVLNSATNDMACNYTPNMATVTTAAAHGFTTGATIGIGGATPAGYNGLWPITITTATQFTYQYAAPAPLAAFSGAGTLASASSGTTTRDLLTRWVRGEDNYGDEASICPPGNPPGVNGCPATPVNIRPSVHGDVLHSRPVVLNYGGTIVNVTSTSDSGTLRTAMASTADMATLSALGTVVPVTFSTGEICAVTVGASSFTYSKTNCGVAGAQTVSAGANDITIFYGGNDGVFRAIDGNPPNYTFIDPNTLTKTTISDLNGGKELWGFVPTEFFGKLKRLHDNTPVLQLPTTPAGIIPAPQRKDYFADGATGFYQAIDGNGKTTKAIIYITMRRGGRFMYAIDVTDHNNPIFLWKRSNADAGFAELGQTWSLPKAVKVKGWANPVLIFGAGYSPAEDSEAPVADTMGRGIFVVDAFTGNMVWSACPAGCTVNLPGATGMAYSIPSDITLLDRWFNDGLIDRIYATDAGGNVWRVDLEPPAGVAPANWQVNKLAALGCTTGVCAAGTTPRKFLFPVEVVPTPKMDYVFVASGDREHPLYTDPASTAVSPKPYAVSPPYAVSAYAVTNRAYLLKDAKPGLDGSGQALVTEAGLFDCSACTVAAPYPGTLNGYYITMMKGEKGVNAPLVVAGFIYFGTNQAQAPNPNQCEEGLGEATGYRLSPFSGALVSGEFENGGLPPSPVAGIVNIIDPVTGKTYQVPFCLGCGGQEDNNNNNNQGANCTGESALAGCRPPINVKSSRSRPYWYRSNK
jgi:type IV pilus assembly protein PilY1